MLTQILKLMKSEMRIDNDSPVTRFNTMPLVSFVNGTLHIDVNSGEIELKAHNKTDFNTVRLPYLYNKHAKCPKWLKFIDEITNGDKSAQAILQEFPGYALLPHCNFQKCLLLKGGGANGKSVYTEIISSILGGVGDDARGYVSYVEPSKFNETFRLMPFMHSFLNISSDTESDLRGGEGVFKRIVAGELLEDSYKFKDPVAFRTRTKLIMCCNNFPIVNDTSEGFIRRFLVVELPMHYVQNPRPHTNERKLDPFLCEALKEELPGIFNWIIEGMKRLIKNKGFSNSRKLQSLVHEFRSVNNPLYSFVEENMHVFFNEDGSGKKLNKRDIFKAYVAWCEEEYSQPISARRFYSNLRSVLGYYGIAFTEKGLIWTFDNNPDMQAQLQQAQQDTQQNTQKPEEEDSEAIDEYYYDIDDADDDQYAPDPQYLQDAEEELDYEQEEDDDLLYAK